MIRNTETDCMDGEGALGKEEMGQKGEGEVEGSGAYVYAPAPWDERIYYASQTLTARWGRQRCTRKLQQRSRTPQK